LTDRIEDDSELSVVFLFQGLKLAGQLGVRG
jgi:hypothetical protein